ncbi:MAG TPA: tryptophan synthase subunit alpha [Ktedonobacterales bacterium]
MTASGGRGERIGAAFARARGADRVALVPYVMAGYPDLATSEALAVGLAEAGADVLELGVPFSDPLADGATIQHAGQVALDHGATLGSCLDLAARLSARVNTPLVLMGYYNPIYSLGVDRFAEHAAASGVAGLIVPDLPPEEAGPLARAASAHGIELIYLVTPSSPDQRIAQVAQAAGATGHGFVYCVSLSGVTGARTALPDQLGAFLARVRARTPLPLAVGFGVSRPEHVAAVGALADGAVMASTLIDAVDGAPERERVAAGVARFQWLATGAPRTEPPGGV